MISLIRKTSDDSSDDDDRCHDHETRIRLLEALYSQLVVRMDRSDATLNHIEKAVIALQDEMKNHIVTMRSHIDQAFLAHENLEMKMHRDMLAKATQFMFAGVTTLIGVVGGLAWWILEHRAGG